MKRRKGKLDPQNWNTMPSSPSHHPNEVTRSQISALEETDVGNLELNVKLESDLQPRLEITHQINCMDCGLGCSTLTELHIHVETFHCVTTKTEHSNIDLDNANSEVPAGSTSSSEVQKHYKKLRFTEVNDKPRPHVCDHCPKTYILRKHLRDHLERSHPEIHYKCEECGNRFNDPEDLDSHVLLHSSEKAFKCSLCSITFKWESSLIGHQLKSHPESEEMTEEFDVGMNSESSTSAIIFPNAELVTLDIEVKPELESSGGVRENRDRPHKCLACQKAYITKRGLLNHLDRVHHNIEKEKKFKCDICGHGSTSESIAKQHARSHSTDTPFECELCNKAFKYQLGLDRHMDEHTNTKEIFQCATCDKKFKSKLGMETHLNLHTTEDKDRMKFRCDCCGMTFLYGTSLTRHRNEQHLKPKTIECRQCSQKFTTTNRLKTHMIKAHTERHFKCNYCEKTFIGKYNLGRHVKQSHSNMCSEFIS